MILEVKVMKSKKTIYATMVITVVLTFIMPVSAMITNEDIIIQQQPSSWIIVETSEWEGDDVPQSGDGEEGNFLIAPTICYGDWEFRDWRTRLIGCYTWDIFVYDGRPHQITAFRNITFYWQCGHIEWINQWRQYDWDGFRYPIKWGLRVRHRIADPINYPLDYITIEGYKTLDGVNKSYYKEIHDEPFRGQSWVSEHLVVIANLDEEVSKHLIIADLDEEVKGKLINIFINSYVCKKFVISSTEEVILSGEKQIALYLESLSLL